MQQHNDSAGINNIAFRSTTQNKNTPGGNPDDLECQRRYSAPLFTVQLTEDAPRNARGVRLPKKLYKILPFFSFFIYFCKNSHVHLWNFSV